MYLMLTKAKYIVGAHDRHFRRGLQVKKIEKKILQAAVTTCNRVVLQS